jgi:hypothetical protein
VTPIEDQPPTIDAVRQVPRWQRQKGGRQELRQPDQPELERIVRDGIDLPGQGGGLDLQRNGRQESWR